MLSLVVCLALAILFTEIIWRYVDRLSPQVRYVWIGMGAAWAATLAMPYMMEPGFQWQELFFAFFSVLLFMFLQGFYERLRGRSSKNKR
jgi:membrane protein implicated in regulation of membrane protease activity